MSEKSVVAVIVEGPSDENAIGGILKKYCLMILLINMKEIYKDLQTLYLMKAWQFQEKIISLSQSSISI